jgi:hypothetical protein
LTDRVFSPYLDVRAMVLIYTHVKLPKFYTPIILDLMRVVL